MRLLKDGFDQVRRSSRSLTEFAMAICGLVLCAKSGSQTGIDCAIMKECH
jgi:hypothetical protein